MRRSHGAAIEPTKGSIGGAVERTKRLLVIDDEPSVREALVGLFELVGYEVREAGSAEAALAAAAHMPFDVALVDVNLGPRSGLDLLPELRALRPEGVLIVLTAVATIEVAVEAMRRGADDFVTKPLDPPRLLAAVASHHERAALRPRRTRTFRVSARTGKLTGEPLVGRQRELELLTGAFAPDRAHVVYLHGIAGIGKSALLRGFASGCRERRARVTELDGRAIEPDALARMIAQGLGRSRWAHAAGRREQVVVIDDHVPDDATGRWIATELAPTLSAGTVVVVASRYPPSEAWAGPGVVTLRLEGLGPAEAAALLKARGVVGDRTDDAVRLVHGHPLALTLAAGMIARHPEAPTALASWPDLVQALVRRLIGESLAPLERAALEVAAVMRRVDESTLAALIPQGDSRQLFDGLAARTFVHRREGGLALDPLARDVLVTDLRWRAPERYAARVIEALDECGARMSRGTPADVELDLLFVLRAHLGLDAGWNGVNEVRAVPARPEDHAAIVALIVAREGHAAGALASAWLGRGMESWVVRGRDGEAHELEGVVAFLALERAHPSDVHADPVARAAWKHAKKSWRQGERVNLVRFCVAVGGRGAGDVALALGAAMHRKHYAAGLAMSLWPVDSNSPVLRLPGVDALAHAPDSDFEHEGRRRALLALDFRQRTIGSWFIELARGLVGVGAAAPAPKPPVPATLGRSAFQRAVRTGLKHLHEPDKLADNPLIRARLVNDDVPPDASPTVRAAALRRLIATAVAELAELPRQAALHAALHHTYVVPAPKQLVAAELAGVSFTSYRRHLLRGAELVAARLWERETGSTP